MHDTTGPQSGSRWEPTANTTTLPNAEERDLSQPIDQRRAQDESEAGTPAEPASTPPATDAATPDTPLPPPPAAPTASPSSPRRFGRTAAATAAVILLVVGGIGGFAIGRATSGDDQGPSFQDRRLPPGFENGTPPDMRGNGDGDGPGFGGPDGGQQGDQNGATGT